MATEQLPARSCKTVFAGSWLMMFSKHEEVRANGRTFLDTPRRPTWSRVIAPQMTDMPGKETRT